MLKGKKILLGVTGGIAAYKSAMIIRLLVKEGAEVRVVMTPSSRDFVTPLTMATLSRNPVLIDPFDPESGEWNSHIDLGIWADLFIIAPATANTLAKMAAGIADNLLLTTYLSVRCPVIVAPAMDLDMYAHPATEKNIGTLISMGVIVIDAEPGELASGLEGKGRMAEPEKIISTVKSYFSKKKSNPLRGKRVLVNAGPTYERIDPVRFIGNFSTGKMGISIAREASARGADVVLVLGPTSLEPGDQSVETIRVESAEMMKEACEKHFTDCDIAILSAAVADFRPVSVESDKIKREKGELIIKLESTADIAGSLGKAKKENQFIAGFALETGEGTESAAKKMKKKNMDMIILNSLEDGGAGFGFDTNRVTIIDKSNNIDKFELKSKALVAKDILDRIERYIS